MTNRGEVGRSRGYGGRIRTYVRCQGIVCTYAHFTVIRQLPYFLLVLIKGTIRSNYVLITEEIGLGWRARTKYPVTLSIYPLGWVGPGWNVMDGYVLEWDSTFTTR